MKNMTRPAPWLSFCLLMTLLGSSAAQAPQPQKPADPPKLKLPAILSSKPLKEDPKDDELRKLLKARYNEAVGEVRHCYEAADTARRFGVTLRGHPDDFYKPWHRLLKAGLELCDKPADKVALLKQYVEITMEAEKMDQARYDAGGVHAAILHRARYERQDAELQLLRAKREADKAKDK